MRKTHWPALLAVLGAAIFPLQASADVRTVSRGVFVDNQRAQQSWLINDTGALIWQDAPYLPVGSAFVSAYLQNQDEKSWQTDASVLQALKSGGITDVIVRAGVPATAVSAGAWQRLIDSLEAQGFTYGIELADGPFTKASGFIVHPQKYKLHNFTQVGQVELNVPNALGGFYVTAEQVSGSVLDSGMLRALPGKVGLNVRQSETRNPTLILFPVKQISTGRGALPDLWQGYDEYRDRLIDFFGQIKFGKGLRFFLDPFRSGIEPAGEAVSAIPDSPCFRIEFEGWLSLKYRTTEDLYGAWGIGRRNVGTYEQAARLTPLWWNGRGVGFAYDRASDRYIEVDVSRSRMWQDILEFRDFSIQEYMNSAADTIKRFGADVPVVFTVGGHNRIFANGSLAGGFDGLAQRAIGDEQDAVIAGEAYGLAADSARTTWLIQVADVGNDPSELQEAFALAKGLGAKAYFASHSVWGPSISSVAELGSLSPDSIPNGLFYPVDEDTGFSVTRLDRNLWWIPTLRHGQVFTFGDNIFAYSLSGPMRNYADSLASEDPAPGGGVALWTNAGSLNITIKPEGHKFAISAADKGAVVSTKKDSVVLRLTESPIVVYGLPVTQLFPVEVAQQEIDNLAKLAASAVKAGGSTAGYTSVIENARALLKQGLALTAYDMAATNMRTLASTAGSYIWIEAEAARDHNFTTVAASVNCSGARFLQLIADEDSPIGAYSATYSFNAPSEGNYELWIAATPPGRPGVSGLRYSIDGADWQVVSPSRESKPHADDMAWFNVGSVELDRGSHSLIVQAVRDRPDMSYNAAIDAIILSRKPFTPAGAKKPPMGQ